MLKLLRISLVVRRSEIGISGFSITGFLLTYITGNSLAWYG